MRSSEVTSRVSSNMPTSVRRNGSSCSRSRNSSPVSGSHRSAMTGGRAGVRHPRAHLASGVWLPEIRRAAVRSTNGTSPTRELGTSARVNGGRERIRQGEVPAPLRRIHDDERPRRRRHGLALEIDRRPGATPPTGHPRVERPREVGSHTPPESRQRAATPSSLQSGRRRACLACQKTSKRNTERQRPSC